jgi:hypothetical protein
MKVPGNGDPGLGGKLPLAVTVMGVTKMVGLGVCAPEVDALGGLPSVAD